MRREQENELRVQFIADVLQASIDAPTPAAQDQAVHAYLQSLQPWVQVAESAEPPRPAFTLFEHVEFTAQGEEDELITLTLTPEGELLFRAWLRRRAFDPERNPPI